MLQIIRKFLKTRKRKGERMPMKKRLLSHKRVLMISKNMSSQRTLKKTKFSKHQTVSGPRKNPRLIKKILNLIYFTFILYSLVFYVLLRL